MLRLIGRSLGALCVACLSEAACTPLRDLDATASGFRHVGGQGGSGGHGVSAGGATGHAGAVPSAGSSNFPAGESGKSAVEWGGAAGLPGRDVAVSGSAGSSNPESGGAAAMSAGAPAVGGASPGDPGTTSFVLDMPNDLTGAPVPGDVTYVESSYTGQSTFQITTPTAIYTVLRQAGTIISLVDQISQGQSVQWVGFNDYRPRRRIGIVADVPPIVATVADLDTVTAKHVRLHCQSASGDWRWDWDFYVTQATLTITQAPSAFGFSYRGTAGKELEDTDRLVLASGQAQSAKNSFSGALVGKEGWAYLADSDLSHSLFLIQHDAASVVARYDSLDGDSASLVLGGGAPSAVPLRFSVGLAGSIDHPTVRSRVEFVINAVP